MGLWFKILVWLGRKFQIEGAPVCRVYNDARTEHYTLTNDGWVISQGVGSKSTDAIPFYMVSQELQDKFAAVLA